MQITNSNIIFRLYFNKICEKSFLEISNVEEIKELL